MRSKKAGHVLFVALVALALAGCAAGGPADTRADGPIEAVATTGMIGDALAAVERIRGGLIELDPDNEADYRANAAAYLGQLEELDAYVRTQTERAEVRPTLCTGAPWPWNYSAVNGLMMRAAARSARRGRNSS